MTVCLAVAIDGIVHVHYTSVLIELSLHTLQRILCRLLRRHTIHSWLLLSDSAGNVGFDEESDEKESQWGEINNVEPNGEGLATGVNTWDGAVLGSVLWDLRGFAVAAGNWCVLGRGNRTGYVFGKSLFTDSA
jgi:hypothetical protein